jgi:dihydrolipoamide dehydrogenase
LGRKQGEERKIVLSFWVGSGGRALKQVLEILKSKKLNKKEAILMYDVVVIGSGPGGYVAAIRLSQLGKIVAVIEKENLGGTCTNKGCIPTKAMLTSSHLYEEILKKSNKLGIKVGEVTYEISEIMKHMKKVVLQSKKGIEYLFKKNHIELIQGTAEITDKNHIKVGDKTIETQNIILAHGSEPVIFSPFDKWEPSVI